MFSRRTFLKNAALTAAAAPFISPTDLLAVTPKHIGVQLWSVREDMNKDPKATIEAIAKMGYREVEPFGFDSGKLFGLSYADFKSLLKNNGISMHSTHCGMGLKNYDAVSGDITDATKKTIDDAAAAGLKYVIVPYMGNEDRPQIVNVVKMLNAAGKHASKAGIKLAYHNHDFEYTTKGPDGRNLMEWILHETDPKQVALEMDLYWVVKAKYNPLDMFRLYPGRVELCHVKDMAKTEKQETVEVGDGSINFKEIFSKASQAGLKYYVVELENYVTTPMQGIDRARKNLVKIF
jgi:sugar phosphate isomerase/epimerase